MKALFATLLLALAGIFLALCAGLYFGQRGMLFPAHLAPPVAPDWQPAGAEQAMLQGRCGKLHVVLWRNPQAHPRGTLMMFHGNGESVASVAQLAPAYHALGYDLMSWDYPGYGRSEACDFSQDDLLQDAGLAYRWLAQRVAENRIVLFGRSVGAGLALHVARDNPVHPVLLVSPYDSLLAVARDQLPGFVPVRLLMRYPMEADAWIGDIRAPIHAVHGLEDRLILPARAAGLMQQARGNMTVEWIADSGHNDSVLLEKSHAWLASLAIRPDTFPGVAP